MVMRVRRGITRTVWLIGPWAVKFPSLRYAGAFFFKGCFANLSEAWLWNDKKDKRYWMAPVLWCGWFGLFLVMRRCEEVKSCSDWEYPIIFHNDMDIKPENIGILNGRHVWIDYAQDNGKEAQ